MAAAECRDGGEAMPDLSRTCRLARWKGRSWAVFSPEGDLVCVTLYKKGAEEVVRRLGPPIPSPGEEAEPPSPGDAHTAHDDAKTRDEMERRRN